MDVGLIASRLDGQLRDVVSRRFIQGAVLHVSSPVDDIELIGASGNMDVDSRYYIASVNKLFISALVLRASGEGRLDLQDSISLFLPQDVVGGLHVYRGRDRSSGITIAHLLSLTSGLPCYLADRQADGRRAMEELEAGIDQPWPVEKVVREVKGMRPHFPPGAPGKAYYADTNHQLLGLVLETITGRPVSAVLSDLFAELGMDSTCVFQGPDEGSFVPIRYRAEEVHIPMFLASTRTEIISTARDQMRFLKAFFEGAFFPKGRLEDLERWNRIFFPFRYGVGLQQFHVPRILSPLHPAPDMVGHCGSVGSVAFYVPRHDLFVTGTVNQQARPNVAFQTIIRLLDALS